MNGQQNDKQNSDAVQPANGRRDFPKKTIQTIAAAGAATIVGAPFIRNARAAQTTTWKIQTSWPGGIGLEIFKKWCNSIIEKTGGELALWFGVVYMVNMQMSFISPPVGYALFYLKSVAPPGVTMGQIYRSSLPFLMLQATALALCIIFPEVVLWLPRQVYGGG